MKSKKQYNKEKSKKSLEPSIINMREETFNKTKNVIGNLLMILSCIIWALSFVFGFLMTSFVHVNPETKEAFDILGLPLDSQGKNPLHSLIANVGFFGGLLLGGAINKIREKITSS